MRWQRVKVVAALYTNVWTLVALAFMHVGWYLLKSEETMSFQSVSEEMIKLLQKRTSTQTWSGAIIGDGDRKRVPFLVLGLALWYGTIFLFLEQIAPSPAAHARTCCEDFCWCRAGEMASKIHEIFYAFGPQLNTFMSVGIWLKYFRRKLLQFEWSKRVSNLGMSSFISGSLTKLCSATSF